MPRDFDAMLTDDQEFTIGGETFKWRYLHWREFSKAIDLEVDRRKADAGGRGSEDKRHRH